MNLSRQIIGLAVGGLLTGAVSSLVFAQESAEDPYPFKPGPNVMLVKQTCSQCHSPNVIVSQTYDLETARKLYKKMMGESPDTERGKKIVEYLSTVMGEDQN